MKATIYSNYGVLAHEKQTIYTADNPHMHADFAEKMTVIIPDEYEPYETESGSVALSVPNGFNPYLLSELLATSSHHKPELHYVDRSGKRHHIVLECAEPDNGEED